MSSRPRWLPLAGAGLGACCALAHHLGAPQRPPDVLQWWTAARAVLHGQDAYQAVHALGLGWPLFYPLTAVLLWLPLAPLPLVAAHMVWSALGGGLLGLAAVRRPALGPALVSLPFVAASSEGHWAPFLVAACVLPWCAVVWAAKPSVGLAYFAGYGRRRSALACLGLVAVSLAVDPSWPVAWLATFPATLSVPPITRPGGVLLLLGFLRWRTPEGRLLGMLALVPQTTVPYEALAVFLCARTKREGYLLAVLSTVAVLGHYLVSGTPATVVEQARTVWPWLLVCCYLPALALVLRPLEGDARRHSVEPAEDPGREDRRVVL